ncbi:hypothetical protein IHN63_00430 [Deinococcus sp. 6YEL10]|uniref:hypothetical protein n=1 Tax=Deinococcus sp. 6YEL10 TaxID=2745870 RepID=UPI001E471EB3|nr:hypothetical protein [Deinococcus sp. 6YEL10]MCD0159765.1 hypothetical protein [Deinococcus sp. 6YEL10]
MPHLARNRYFPQATTVPGTLNLETAGGAAEEVVLTSDASLTRPLDVLMVKTRSPLDFFYIREASDRPVRGVSVLFDNTANRDFTMQMSYDRAGVQGGTPLLPVPDGLLYSAQRVWYSVQNLKKEVHRSLKEDGLRLNLFHAEGYDLIGASYGTSESEGELSGVADFEGPYTNGVCSGWEVFGGVAGAEPKAATGLNHVQNGEWAQKVTLQPGESTMLLLSRPVSVTAGNWYDFRVRLHTSLPCRVDVLDVAGRYAGPGGTTTLAAQQMSFSHTSPAGTWLSANGVVQAAQSVDETTGQPVSQSGAAYSQLRPAVRVTAPADATGPVTVYFDQARLRQVTLTPFDVEVTGFGVPVNGIGEDGRSVRPLFSDVLEPEDIARRLLGRVKGVLGDSDDDRNPMWAVAVGMGYGMFPQYMWSAFKEYRIDPALCPHRELRTLAAALGEPLFDGMLPAERRRYVKSLTSLIHLKGSSACISQLFDVMGLSGIRIRKLSDTLVGHTWHYAIFLNAQVSRARLLTLQRMVDHWSPAWMSYEIVQGAEPWRLDVSLLDNDTTLARPGDTG